MHYSPVRRSSAGCKHPLLPLDLHVLSLPPAFNLSHDQTLQFKSYKNPKILYSCSRQNSISTSHCPDISYPKYLGQRPHELLGQLFKERLSCCSIKAAYSTSFRCLVNRLLEEFSNSFSSVLSNSCIALGDCCEWLVPQKWCAFYRRQENCQRGF